MKNICGLTRNSHGAWQTANSCQTYESRLNPTKEKVTLGRQKHWKQQDTQHGPNKPGQTQQGGYQQSTTSTTEQRTARNQAHKRQRGGGKRRLNMRLQCRSPLNASLWTSWYCCPAIADGWQTGAYNMAAQSVRRFFPLKKLEKGAASCQPYCSSCPSLIAQKLT